MSRVPVKRLIALAAVVAAASACSSNAEGSADDFPEKAITWVVPYDAGGNTDSISRAVAKAMGDELGEDIVVENKPGGSGAIGMQAIKNAKPDGYTIGLFTTGTMVVTPMVNDLDYSEESFTNLGLMLTQPVVIMTGTSSEYSSIEDLVAGAKAAAGKLTVGVPGATTPQAYELTRLAEDHGVELTTVPFDSNAEVITALRGGNVDAVALNASQEVVTQIESGELTPLAVGEAERLAWLPDTPTLVESGFDGLDASGTHIGVIAPEELPDGVESTLQEALDAALQDESVQELLGADNIADEFVGGDDLTSLLSERRALYEGLIGK